MNYQMNRGLLGLQSIKSTLKRGFNFVFIVVRNPTKSGFEPRYNRNGSFRKTTEIVGGARVLMKPSYSRASFYSSFAQSKLRDKLFAWKTSFLLQSLLWCSFSVKSSLLLISHSLRSRISYIGYNEQSQSQTKFINPVQN